MMKKLLKYTNETILAMNMGDTLRSLGIQFRPFTNSVFDIEYINGGVLVNTRWRMIEFYMGRKCMTNKHELK
jgi:hypothetical protein